MRAAAALAVAAVVGGACGGKVVFVETGAGGAGASSSSINIDVSASSTGEAASSTATASIAASSGSGGAGTVAQNCDVFCMDLDQIGCNSGNCSGQCNSAYMVTACPTAYAAWLECTIEHLAELQCGTLPPDCSDLYAKYASCG